MVFLPLYPSSTCPPSFLPSCVLITGPCIANPLASGQLLVLTLCQRSRTFKTTCMCLFAARPGNRTHSADFFDCRVKDSCRSTPWLPCCRVVAPPCIGTIDTDTKAASYSAIQDGMAREQSHRPYPRISPSKRFVSGALMMLPPSVTTNAPPETDQIRSTRAS